MNFNFVAGIATTVALFIPVLLILAGRLFTNGSLLALFVYYFLSGLYNLSVLGFIKLPAVVERRAAVAFNYLDAPLMLVVLLFFCNEVWKRRLVLLTLVLFVLFETGVALRFGLDTQSSVYLLGPGTLLILSLSIYFFAYYGKICIVQGKGLGKTFMLVSILFSYGCFVVIYYVHYLAHAALADVFLVYYISVFISAVIMSIGLVWIIRRAREIKELQLTRKELALFFDN